MKKIKELLNKKSVYYVCLFILVFALHLFMKPGKADDSWFINNYKSKHDTTHLFLITSKYYTNK